MKQTSVFSDLNGSVWKILVSEGDLVAEDDTLAVLESMKMEIPVLAPVTGKVEKILVVEGQPVSERTPILTISH
jgi:acetyl-CoA carboxylase biotin carboxyl carrier protein